MRYYSKGNLSDFISKNHLSLLQKENLLLRMLSGLSFLHQHKIVHGKIKPSNILIHERDNRQIIPKIADFGLCKEVEKTFSGRFINNFRDISLEYSSPEQLNGEPLRFNTDLWSWGVIAYEILTETSPFEDSSNSINNNNNNNNKHNKQVYDNILKKDILSNLKHLPIKWQNALLRCLVGDPEERVKSAEEIKNVLEGKTSKVSTNQKKLCATNSSSKGESVIKREISTKEHLFLQQKKAG